MGDCCERRTREKRERERERKKRKRAKISRASPSVVPKNSLGSLPTRDTQKCDNTIPQNNTTKCLISRSIRPLQEELDESSLSLTSFAVSSCSTGFSTRTPLALGSSVKVEVEVEVGTEEQEGEGTL
jgi:hypothetical protein